MALKLSTLASLNVTTAGTRVQLSATDVWANRFQIQAKTTNTGKIYVGDSVVSSTRGHELKAGETLIVEGSLLQNSLEEVNLADLWIDSSANGEGVNLTYLKRRP